MSDSRVRIFIVGLSTFVATLIVLAAGATWGSLVQAGVLTVLVTTLCAVVFATPRLARETPDPERGSAALDERGITIKLLELMALSGRYGNPLSVALVGVDHYAHLKERYGGDVADAVASAIAEIVTETLRMPDHVGRVETHRFLVILPETTLRGARQIGERIRLAVAGAEIPVDERRRVSPTVSIGVSLFRDGDDLEQLLGRVGKVLAQAETQGRNRVIVDLAA